MQKTPKMLLMELCQKTKKFQKPKYYPDRKARSGGGYLCKVFLPGRNDRDSFSVWSREKARTPEDAAQHAAVAALHRVAGDRQYNRILPDEYRGVWEAHIDDARMEEERRAKRERAKEEEERRRKRKAREPQVLYLGEDKRRIIEDALARVRDGDVVGGRCAQGRVHTAAEDEIAARLTNMGFEVDDVRQACTYSSEASLESALDWLCINLGDARLPAKFVSKKGHSLKVLVSGVNDDDDDDVDGGDIMNDDDTESTHVDAEHEEDGLVESDMLWLVQCGYSRDASARALRDHHGSRRAAFTALNTALASEVDVDMSLGVVEGGDTNSEFWDEELEVLTSIYDTDLTLSADRQAGSIRIPTDGNEHVDELLGTAATLFLEFVAPPTGYPDALPTIGVRATSESMPTLRACAAGLLVKANKYRGEAMLHSLAADCIDCLEEAIVTAQVRQEETSTRVSNSSRTESMTTVRRGDGAPISSSESRFNTNVEEEAKDENENAGLLRDIRPHKTRTRDARLATATKRVRSRDVAFEKGESARLFDWHQELMTSSAHSHMRAVRRMLPAASMKSTVLDIVRANAVVVLTGQTGCGKSTQVPQFLLEDAIENRLGGATNIICTQPRRVAALGLAERVAAERGEKTGESVGYAVRLESKRSARTRLLFCTTGILLRRLINDNGDLSGVTHIVLDEVHERSVESDLLLLLLRDIQKKSNRSFRLVLMSATADADTFVRYFGGPKVCGTVFIPGFTHPVREFYLEDILELTGFRIGKGSRYARKGGADSKRAHRSGGVTEANVPESKNGKASTTSSSLSESALRDAPPEGGMTQKKSSTVSEQGGGERNEQDVPDSWEDEEEGSSGGDHSDNDEEKSDGTDDASENHGEVIDDDMVDLRDKDDRNAYDEDEDNYGTHGRARDLSSSASPNTWLTRDQARMLLTSYSDSTQKSIEIVDESIINYILIERVLCYILHTEATQGARAMVGANAKDTSRDGGGESVNVGGILIFLPGAPEIGQLQRALRSSNELAASTEDSLIILPLHGGLSASEQSKVFQRVPRGSRLIVLATNVAETSVTIDGIVYVIDTGRHKEISYDPSRGLTSLQEGWVSAAAATQRRGRAGRTRPGACFRIFSRVLAAEMTPQQAPEVLRTSLEQLALRTKAVVGARAIASTLSDMPTPPKPEAVHSAIASLTVLQALDEDENLTPLGQHLVNMPVDARVGKMLLLGVMLRCLDPILTIAAALADRPPFIHPSDAGDRVLADEKRHAFAGSSRSDHIAMASAYKVWAQLKEQQGRDAARKFAVESFLSDRSMETIDASRRDYASVLSDMGFIPHRYCGHRRALSQTDRSAIERVNALAQDGRIVKAILCAGFYPNIINIVKPENRYVQIEGGAFAKDPSAKEVRFFCRNVGRVFLHPTSVNFSAGRFESPWLLWTDRVETSKVFIRQSSMISPYAALLFGGALEVRHEAGLLTLDAEWKFKAPAKIGILIRELREEVRRLLALKLEDPGLQIDSSPIVDALLTLLSSDGL